MNIELPQHYSCEIEVETFGVMTVYTVSDKYSRDDIARIAINPNKNTTFRVAFVKEKISKNIRDYVFNVARAVMDAKWPTS